MFNRDRWKEILEVLTKNWFRTVLTAFGVFWGILILIILLAAGKAAEAYGLMSKLESVNPVMASQFEDSGYRALGLDRI